MFKRKVIKVAERRIWRISPTHPGGEFVSSAARQDGSAVAAAEIHGRGLRESSQELASGSDVLETDMDTLPGEWISAFDGAGEPSDRGAG